MYLAHTCPQCNEQDIVYSSFECSCGFTETEDMFWQHMRNEGYLRDIEAEIDNCYPYKKLSSISSVMDLMVGYHILGQFDSRDYCLNSLKNSILELHKKWGICYTHYSSIESTIEKYEKVQKQGYKEESQYIANMKTAREFFKDIPSQWKALLK